MNIQILNANMDLIGSIRYINLQWNRRYYECGDFEIMMMASDYSNDARYLYTPDRKEVGIIQKVYLKKSIKGNFTTISGFFYEFMLNDKIVYPIFKQTHPLETIAWNMVNTYKSDIPRLTMGTNQARGNTISLRESDAELGRRLYDMLKVEEYGYRTRYDHTNKHFIFEVWQGLDRTQDQSTNTFYTFSDKTFKEIEVIVDDSNFKNSAIVVGNGEYEEGGQISTVVSELTEQPYMDIVKISGKTSISGSGTYVDPYIIQGVGPDITFTNTDGTSSNSVTINEVELLSYGGIVDTIVKSNGKYYTKKRLVKKRLIGSEFTHGDWAYKTEDTVHGISLYTDEETSIPNIYSTFDEYSFFNEYSITSRYSNYAYISINLLKTVDATITIHDDEINYNKCIAAAQSFISSHEWYIVYDTGAYMITELSNQVPFTTLTVYNGVNEVSCNYNTSGITIFFDNKTYNFTNAVRITTTIITNYEKQLFVDCKSTHYDSADMTIAQFREFLATQGRESLLEHQIVNNINVKIRANVDDYLKEWDLGDKVDVVISSLGLSFTARVIEVYEVEKSNTRSIEVTLGNKMPTKSRKAR